MTATYYMKDAQRLRKEALKAIKEGSCTKAYLNVVEMWNSIGRSEVSGREAGKPVWRPTSEIADLGYEFSTKCLRDTPSTLSGAKKRK